MCSEHSWNSITRLDVTRRVIGQNNRPMTSISLCHSMNLEYRLTLIIIASSTLFSGRAENIMSMFVAITMIIPAYSWRPLQIAVMFLACYENRSDRCSMCFSRDTDSDICVIEILRRTCNDRAEQWRKIFPYVVHDRRANAFRLANLWFII